jgi:hypothetical protein
VLLSPRAALLAAALAPGSSVTAALSLIEEVPVIRLVALLVVVLAASSCGRQCEQVTPTVTALCRQASDGAIHAGTPFTIRALPPVSAGTCEVAVNGSQLTVTVSGTVCGSGGDSAKRVSPTPVPCLVPALDAGTYSLDSTSQIFSVPSAGGTTLPACP